MDRERVVETTLGASSAMTVLDEIAPAPSFRDPQLESRFREDGYAVLDLIDHDRLGALRELCAELHPDQQPGYDSDFFSPDTAVKRTVHEALTDALRAGIARHLTGHRSMLHAFILNWPGPEGGLVLHQHTSVVDETRFRSMVAWCAITDATEENGTLHVVPGSHRLQRGPHPERARSWAEDHRDLLMRDHLVSVPLRAGQALLFDNRLLHCSIANTTDEPRVSAAAVIVPTAAEPRYYEAVDSSRVRIYRLDSEFFLANAATDFSWPEPEGLPFVAEEAWSPTEITVSELRSALPAGTCNHPS